MEKGFTFISFYSLHLLLNSVWFGFLALYSTQNGLVKDLFFACLLYDLIQMYAWIQLFSFYSHYY